jgi:hypothetical protein
MAIVLQQIDGGSNYYANNGFTYAANAGWDNPNFFPIGPWEAPIFDQNDVNTYKSLHWNTFFNITANTNLSLARSNGFWIIQNASDGILPGTGSETVGLLSADENYSASVNSVNGTANSVQDGRFWWLQNTWNTLVPNASIAGTPMAQIMSQQLSTPNGTTRNLNALSADFYWFSGIKDGGMESAGGQIYNLGRPMTVAEGARGSNYGDMIDIQRSYMTADPGPIFSFVEVGEPGNSPSATAADYITPAELNWADWSSLIHGARGIIYFNNTFTGPAQASNAVETTYYQTVQPGQTVSIDTQIQNTDALIQQLAPVLNSPFALNYVSVSGTKSGSSNYIFGNGPDLTLGGLEVMAKDDNGQFFIFADTREPGTETNIPATFTIADPNATSVTVVGENRTIPVVNGVFSDTFATAATVHIYEVNDGGSPPTTTPPPTTGGSASPPTAPVISSGVVNPNTDPTVALTGTAPAGSTVTVSDGGSTPLGTTTASSSGTWSYTTPDLPAGTYAFTATDTTSAGTSAASGAFNVTVPDSPSQPSGTNLVANGDFATGSFSGWTRGGNAAASSYGPQIYIDTTGAGGSKQAAAIGSMGSDGTLSQTIATTAGQTYTLSFWLKNNAAGPNDFSAIWNGQKLLSLSNSTAFGYTEYTYTVTAAGSSTVLEFSGRQDPSHWDIDNISLTANGAPASTPGPTTVGSGAKVEIATADSQSVTFAAATGALKLDAPSTFTGTIYNFTGDGTLSGSNQIDLTNINFNSVKASYSKGVLTVTDGENTDKLNFNGHYTLANFKFASDGSGGTIVYDPPVSPSSSGGGGSETDALGPPRNGSSSSAGIGTLKGMELPAIAFDPQTTLGYLPNRQSIGGTPPFTDVTNGRNMALLGTYVASSFAIPGDNYGGTMLAGGALESHHSLLTVPQHA